MKALQTRLGVGLLAALLGVFGALWWSTREALHILAEDTIYSRLEHDAETLLGVLGQDGTLDPAPVDAVYLRPFSGHYYQVITAHRSLRSRSLWDEDLDVAALPPGRVVRTRTAGPAGQRLLVRVAGYQKEGSAITIAVAEDLSPAQARIDAFQKRFALIAGGGMLCLILLQGAILHWGLSPLVRLRRELDALVRGEQDALATDVPAEVRTLVDEINRVARLQAERLRRYRDALGDMAHAAKGPLTVMRQAVEGPELAGREPLRQRLAQQLDRLQAQVERALRRARLAGGGAPLARFRPHRDIPPLLDSLRRIYPRTDLRWRYEGPTEGDLNLDREDALELLGNLLDNACKWARQTVALDVTDNGRIAFCIEDDGPGIAPDQIAQLLNRGTRLDEDVAGYGLGLAIVKDMVREYGGELTLGRSPRWGGLRARVCLPARTGRGSDRSGPAREHGSR